MFWALFTIVTCVKILFIPSYRSTDFEVHRNWLAITHSTELKSWYKDESSSSPWTLDYPPYFAYFEYLLSLVASLVDPAMLDVRNLNYASDVTILFQRFSVIITDLVFAFGAKQCSEVLAKKPHQKALMLLLLLSNAGLFIVDHIHFQYNGLLSGLLLLSISSLASHSVLLAGLLFSGLLMFKHIYLYIAPAFIVYMFRNYCFKTGGRVIWSSISVTRLVLLGLSVLVNVTAAMAPFILTENFSNVISRLFPFKRGLCHAYWAPNLWAVYNVVDKGLVVLGRRLGLSITEVGSMTGGLVQDIHHSVLPNISPLITIGLTIALWLPALVKLWSSPGNIPQFIRCLALCGWTSFLCGWHVHEKAILIVILPMTLLACINRVDARYFLILATVGHLSLLPLLFTGPELLSKLLLLASYSLVLAITLYRHSAPLSPLEAVYLLASVPLLAWCELLGCVSLPFLPLLATSLYCALGVTYAYVGVYVHYLQS